MVKTSGARSEAATAIFALVALVVVAAFLAWLAMTSEPSVVAVPEQEDETLAQANEPGLPLSVDEFAANVARHVGQTIELQNATVAEALGTQILILDLPQGRYVVRRTGMASAAATPANGGQVTVVGTVLEKTPALIDSWVATGAITEAQRSAVQPGDTFIEARELRAPGS
jgi:hypothetical protein